MHLKYIESTITSYLHCKIHLIISDVKVVLSFVSDSGNKNIKVTVTYGFHLLQAMSETRLHQSTEVFFKYFSNIQGSWDLQNYFNIF